MSLLGIALGVGCSGDDPGIDTDTDTDTDTVDVVTTPTGDKPKPKPKPLVGEFGSIVMGHRGIVPATGLAAYEYYGVKAGKDGYYAFGVFADSLGGWVDAAYCLFAGPGCVDAYPAAGDTVALPDLKKVYYGPLYSASFRDAGATIDVGGQALQRVNLGVVAYAAEPYGLPAFGTLEIGGQLAAYQGTDDVPVLAGTLTTKFPEAGVEHTVEPGDTFALQWEPAYGVGEMYLQTADTLTGLVDDGAHDIDVDSLGFRSPLDSRIVTLARIASNTVDAAGNSVSIQTRSEQPFVLNYVDTKGWTELVDGTTLVGTCKAASGLAALAPGRYVGDVSSYLNDLDLGAKNKLTGFATVGREGIVRVDLVKGQVLTATYRQSAWDGAMYLMGDDCEPANAVEAADDTYQFEEESLTFTAPASATYLLAIDNWQEGGTFALELEVDAR